MRARVVPCQDEYHEGEESVVLVNQQVVALSPLATWLLARTGADWTEVDEIAMRMQARFGTPPDGSPISTATEAALRSLAEIGLVALDE